MSNFDLSLRSSRSSYFSTFRHQLTILSKTDALDEEKWVNMLGKFVKDWFRYESHFVHGRDSLVDILKDFFLQCYGDHRDLHSFPTRRSSDLLALHKRNPNPLLPPWAKQSDTNANSTRCRHKCARSTFRCSHLLSDRART